MQIRLRGLQVRLLHKLLHRKDVSLLGLSSHGVCPLNRTALNITIPRLRRRRHDTEGQQGTLLHRVDSLPNRSTEGGSITNDMIRSQDQQQRISTIRHRLQSRHSHRRGRVPPDRFKNHGLGGLSDLTQLFGDHETMSFVADHQRSTQTIEAFQAQHGLLQHGSLTDQWQQLLRIELTGQGPETGAGTTA